MYNMMHIHAFWQVDSGFFCEGYSSDEDVLLKEEFRGNILKQGCLLKQVNEKAGVPVFLLHFSHVHIYKVKTSIYSRRKYHTVVLWWKMRTILIID